MEIIKKEGAENLLKKMKENLDLSFLKDLVKDNKKEFEHNGTIYRTRLLTMLEKEKINALCAQEFGRLMKNKDILTEEQIIKNYKEKGTDLKKLYDDEIEKLRNDKKGIDLKLGEAIAKKVDDKVWKVYEEQIDEIDDKIKKLIIEKTPYLHYSLENCLKNFSAKCVAVFSIEKKNGETWEKVFTSLEDFDKCEDEDLKDKTFYYGMMIN